MRSKGVPDCDLPSMDCETAKTTTVSDQTEEGKKPEIRRTLNPIDHKHGEWPSEHQTDHKQTTVSAGQTNDTAIRTITRIVLENGKPQTVHTETTEPARITEEATESGLIEKRKQDKKKKKITQIVHNNGKPKTKDTAAEFQKKKHKTPEHATQHSKELEEQTKAEALTEQSTENKKVEDHEGELFQSQRKHPTKKLTGDHSTNSENTKRMKKQRHHKRPQYMRKRKASDK